MNVNELSSPSFKVFFPLYVPFITWGHVQCLNTTKEKSLYFITLLASIIQETASTLSLYTNVCWTYIFFSLTYGLLSWFGQNFTVSRGRFNWIYSRLGERMLLCSGKRDCYSIVCMEIVHARIQRLCTLIKYLNCLVEIHSLIFHVVWND